VIQQVLTAPDNSAPFGFTIDQSTWISLLVGRQNPRRNGEQKRSEATGPNSLTEPRRVHIMTIRTDQAEQKSIESTQPPTASNR
jgi:hypothetical protein